MEGLVVRWTKAVNAGKAGRASFYAGWIRAASILGFLPIVANPVLMVAAVAGDMAGSYLGVKLDQGTDNEGTGD